MGSAGAGNGGRGGGGGVINRVSLQPDGTGPSFMAKYSSLVIGRPYWRR
jgi:hypothetical protein